ncbi:hypothetical protein AOLI_G00168070 [Acnodon oligacanthus]
MLPALCSLFTALSCVSGVTVVTQKLPVLTPTKGEKITMHCNLGTVTDSSARWYKQVPGEAPQYVLENHHSYSSPYYGSGFSSPKFTSTHSSQSDYTLIISNVEVGDSAVYYCKTWDGSVRDTFADVRWLVDKAVSSGVTTGSAEQQPNKKFRLNSYLTIERSEWDKDKAIACEVSAASKATTKEIKKGTKLIVTDSAVPAPVVTIFPPSSEELKSNKATLVCLANDMSSAFADVRWLVDGKAVSSGVTTGSAEQQPNKKFRLSSYLTIERSEWDKDKAITCEVSAASKATTKEIKKSECSD